MTEPSTTATVTIGASGRRTVTGDKTGTLKQTQTYTKGFGKAVQAAWASDQHTYRRLQCTNPSDEWCDEPSDPSEAWEDLDLEPLAVLLRDRFSERVS